MRERRLLILAAAAVLLGGCSVRWQPQRDAGPAQFSEACPNRRAPAVEAFGASGVSGVYHFVTEDASNAELGALIEGTQTQRFSLAPITVNINGRNTVFAMGPTVLRTQREVDAEFQSACALGHGRVYLTHVRYNPVQAPGEDVRVR